MKSARRLTALIEKLYRDLVNHYIAEEMSQWQKQSDGESE